MTVLDPVEDSLFLNKTELSLGSLHICIHTCAHKHIHVVCSETHGGQSREELAGMALELCFQAKRQHF